MATTVRLTADDLATLPDDGWRYDLIRGELIRQPPNTLEQGLVVANVMYPLGVHARDRQLGKVLPNVGFVLERDPDTVIGPQVAFVQADRLPPRDEDAYPDLAPDLVVEVLAASSEASMFVRKLAVSLAGGVRRIWIVDPSSRSVAVFGTSGTALLGDGDTLDGGDVLPSFSIPVADLFA